MDFRSNPSLNDSILHHFIDVDDLLDFLLSSATQQITLIVSDLLSRIASDVLRPIFAQLVRLLIIGKSSLAWENAEDFANAQSLVAHLSFCLRSRRRLSITFDSWPVEHTSHDLLQCSQIRTGSALLIPFDVPRGSNETLRQQRILVDRCHSNRRERLAVQVHHPFLAHRDEGDVQPTIVRHAEGEFLLRDSTLSNSSFLAFQFLIEMI